MGVLDDLRKALLRILEENQVPAANEQQCGNWQDHNITKAKEYARLFLASSR
jgi:S-ribosylhomocysteine lyase